MHAGFLRIPQAKNPLDNSAVHPESYPIVEQIAKDLNCTVDELIKAKELRSQLISRVCHPDSGASPYYRHHAGIGQAGTRPTATNQVLNLTRM